MSEILFTHTAFLGQFNIKNVIAGQMFCPQVSRLKQEFALLSMPVRPADRTSVSYATFRLKSCFVLVFSFCWSKHQGKVVWLIESGKSVLDYLSIQPQTGYEDAVFFSVCFFQTVSDSGKIAVCLEDDGIPPCDKAGMKFFLIYDAGENMQYFFSLAQDSSGTGGGLLKGSNAGRHLYRKIRSEALQRAHEITKGAIDQWITQCQKCGIFAAVENLKCQAGIVFPCRFQNGLVACHGKVQPQRFHILAQVRPRDG